MKVQYILPMGTEDRNWLFLGLNHMQGFDTWHGQDSLLQQFTIQRHSDELDKKLYLTYRVLIIEFLQKYLTLMQIQDDIKVN